MKIKFYILQRIKLILAKLKLFFINMLSTNNKNNNLLQKSMIFQLFLFFGGFILAGVLYGGILKLYLNKINPISEINKVKNLADRLDLLAARRKEMLMLMGFVAPIATVTIIWFGKMSAGDLINVTLHSNEIKDVTSEAVSLGFMTRFFLNKKFNWFKYLLIVLTIIFVFKSNLYLYLLPYITIQRLKYFWLFGVFNSMLYFAFNYIFYIMLNKNTNFIIPSNLPGFLRNHLNSLKLLSKNEFLYLREMKRNKLLAIVSLIVFISGILII